MTQTEQVVTALEAIVKIGGGLLMDCYMVHGEFRYGLSQVSELLGYDSRHYSQVVRGRGNKLKGLYSKGFTGGTVLVKVPRSTGGVTRAKTLGFDDFCVLVEYEAVEVKNSRAIALLTSAFREVLRGRTQVAFGLAEDDLEIKQKAFWEAFQESEIVWDANREDFDGLTLAGDEDLNVDEYYPEIAIYENEMLLVRCGVE